MMIDRNWTNTTVYMICDTNIHDSVFIVMATWFIAKTCVSHLHRKVSDKNMSSAPEAPPLYMTFLYVGISITS